MVLIHEKINAVLGARRLKKRDLARALEVSPQTATDICKGRSAVTLRHLRNLVNWLELRADFWLDETRLLPEASDHVSAALPVSEALARTGMLQVKDPERLVQRIRGFLADHRSAFLSRNVDLGAEERRVLGMTEPARPAAPVRTAEAGE
jgi:transcriptional regulator with XRE-family HTH domain